MTYKHFAKEQLDEIGTYFGLTPVETLPVRDGRGGRIPTVQDWFQNIKMEAWMNRGYQVGPA